MTGRPTKRLQAAVRDALPCEFHVAATLATASTDKPPPGETGTLPSGETVDLIGTTLRIGTTDPAVVQPTLDALRAGELVIRSVRPVRQSLEDFFMEAVAELREGSSPAATQRKGVRP